MVRLNREEKVVKSLTNMVIAALHLSALYEGHTGDPSESDGVPDLPNDILTAFEAHRCVSFLIHNAATLIGIVAVSGYLWRT